jgi:TPP-dependent indolepyruvate ferredoxin oxidoreductase alpha subunit
MNNNESTFALLLMKEESIIQIRTLQGTQEYAIEQAKIVRDFGKNKFDNVNMFDQNETTKVIEHKNHKYYCIWYCNK